jgi:hypothetical protein
MKNLFKILALLFAMGLFIVSCENITDEPQIDEEIAQDNALAKSAIGDVFGVVNTGRNSGSGKVAAGCFTATYTTNTRTLVIEYPSEGCTSVMSSMIFRVKFVF